jgi:Ca2+-binding EF-hand superfamily protein
MIKTITNGGNKNHNPFKTLIKKLDFFLEVNKTTISELLARLDPIRGPTDGVSLETFAKFLKEKVEKSKDLENLKSYSNLMDIDKDGRISKDDLQTCIVNINSDQFFKNGG